MATAFAEIAFTSSVKAAQVRYGSREANSRFELADDPGFGMTDAYSGESCHPFHGKAAT